MTTGMCGSAISAGPGPAPAAAAVGWFERNQAACGSPGLLTEEYDVRQRQLRGNLPQAFVHALMIESAARLTRPWDAP